MRKKEWFDDSFWRDLYPFMFPKERIADAEKQSEKRLALTKLAGKFFNELELHIERSRRSIRASVEKSSVGATATRQKVRFLRQFP